CGTSRKGKCTQFADFPVTKLSHFCRGEIAGGPRAGTGWRGKAGEGGVPPGAGGVFRAWEPRRDACVRSGRWRVETTDFCWKTPWPPRITALCLRAMISGTIHRFQPEIPTAMRRHLSLLITALLALVPAM